MAQVEVAAAPAAPKLGALIGERPWLAVLGIVLVGAALRLWNLGGPSLWIDEISSVSFARVPVNLLWGDWMLYETNPPLYYTLLKFWIGLFGESEFAVRAMSVVFGLGAIVAIFVLGRALHSTQAGVLAALFCALAAEQLGYSQETRGYMLGFLASTLAAWALLRLTDLWRAGPSTLRQTAPWLALYAGAAAVAVYTHTTFFVLPVLANLYMAWVWLFRTPRRMNDALGWIGANTILAALWAWWILMTIRQVQTGAETASWIPSPNIRDVVAITSHIVATRSFELFNLLFAAVFGALMAWGAWKLPLERRVFAIVFAVGIPLLLIGISFIKPIFLERTLFWAQFIYIACLGVGVATLPWARWRWAVAAAIALVLVVDAMNWSRTTYREPWRDVATILRDHAGPNDAVLTYSAAGGVNFTYYCRRLGCENVPVLALATTRGKRGLGAFFEGAEVSAENAGQTLAPFERIWVIARTDDDPTTVLQNVATREEEDRLGDETGRMRLSVWRTR
jgi:4-amino-4-deoxy-L-arabinose transferase-like glycosyltransferase